MTWMTWSLLALLHVWPCHLPAQSVRSDTAPALLELRLVEAIGGVITRRFADVAYPMGSPLVTDADVASLSACAVDGVELLVTLTEDGGRRVQRATANALGGQLAVLVNGRLWSAPAEIVSAIGDRPIAIAVPAAPADAERLITLFRTRWLPRRPC